MLSIRKELVPEDGLVVGWSITPAELGLVFDELLLDCQDIRFEGSIQRQGDDLIVRGRLTGEVTVACARCLDPARIPITSSVDSMFLAVTAGAKKTARDKGEADEEEQDTDWASTDIYDGDELDLQEFFRDSLLLDVPLKPLCSPECRGLCPQCGANLNHERCSCPKVPTDARLLQLLQWKRRAGSEGESR